MSTKYTATITEQAFFITITTVGWIDVFSRLNQKYNIINALDYCQKNKGLEIYSFVIMSNHIHLLCKATDGFILSCCSVSEAGEDRVYLIVRRAINGVERTFVERMASTRWDDIADCCFLDCAVSYEFDQPRNTFLNLWHLEGRVIWGLIDGFVIKDLLVQNGRVTLPASAGAVRKATFGIPFDVDIQTMPVMFNGGSGSNAARKQQPGEIVLHVRQSRNILAGAGREDGEEPVQLFEIKSRGDEPWGAVDTLKDGKYLMDSPNVVSGQASVYVKQVDPLPLTLLGVYLDPIVGG